MGDQLGVIGSGLDRGFASLRRPADPARRAVRAGPTAAAAGAALGAGRLDAAGRPARPGRPRDRRHARGPGRAAGPGPGRPDGRPRRTRFLRGTAGDHGRRTSPRLPATGITPVICGDAHLGNFGFYASPERDLVFDLNDFDEAHPGRLGVGPAPAGRQRLGGRAAERLDRGRSAATRSPAACAAYRDAAALPGRAAAAGTRSYERLDVDRLHGAATDPTIAASEIERAARRARTRTSDRALPRFTEQRDGGRRIVEEPPLITRLDDARRPSSSPRRLDDYLRTLPPHWAPRRSAATRWSTSRTRWSASAVGRAARLRRAAARAAARTTCCSCSSSRPAGRWWRRSCTATRPGTPTRASASSSTSRRCRRSATRCSAGPRSATGSTTCASSAT